MTTVVFILYSHWLRNEELSSGVLLWISILHILNNHITLFFSGFVYIRVLSFWAFVLIIDFLLEFRLELLWPLWLFLTSVYDSFKYQGLVTFHFMVLSNFLNDVTKLFLLSGLFSIFCLLVTHSRFSLFPLHPSTMALFCGSNLCMDTICLAHRLVHLFILNHNYKLYDNKLIGCLTIVIYRKRDMSTNHLPVGAIHLCGGFNTVERSETFPSSFGSLSAFCRALYRLSCGYMGIWY